MKDGDSMSSKKNQIDYNKYLNDLINLLSSSTEEDPKFLKESLETEGYNYDELVEEGINFVHDLEREYKFSIAKEKRRHYESLKNVVKDTFQGTKEELLNALRSLITSGQLQTEFHKFESLEFDDLKSIVKDYNILDIIEKEFGEENESNDK